MYQYLNHYSPEEYFQKSIGRNFEENYLEDIYADGNIFLDAVQIRQDNFNQYLLAQFDDHRTAEEIKEEGNKAIVASLAMIENTSSKFSEVTAPFLDYSN